MLRNLRTTTGAALALFLAGTALAATPAQKCESAKNKEAGKYGYCRQKADSKYASTGDAAARTTAFQKCLTKYDLKWPGLEAKAVAAGGACPSTGDQTAIQQYLATATTNVATALSGGVLPDCAGDLLACQGDLGTCNGSLGTCGGDLTTCQGSLSTTQGSLTTCTGDLGTCNGSLGTTQASLTTCNGNLTACSGNLSTCNGSLGTTQASLTTCTGDLGTCNGTLTTCQNDLTACLASTPQSQRLKTGQTQCWNAAGAVIPCAGTGQDGELQKGLAGAYVDNGDGTITDTKTGLMWEKVSDDGSIHDKDTTYTWTNVFAVKVAALNGGGGFAGHTDWRVPNANELQSIVSYGASNPAVAPAFNTGCAPACTVLTCSCTVSNAYWSSSTYHFTPQTAFWVYFLSGGVDANSKSNSLFVRAVRGGS